MQAILYSNKKLGKARKYKVRWEMEFPDEWLAHDKVPKDLRDMFETRIRKRKEVLKKLNSSSDKVSDSTIFEIQQMRYTNRFLFFT
jgi:hypothetical protein